MRTPAGKECIYFYGDYYRGRDFEECRLLVASNPPQKWKRDLCFNCPVPDLLLANACPHLVLEGRVERAFPFAKKRVSVTASCSKTQRAVAEPEIGCGECHPLPSIFAGVTGESDDSA